MVRIHHTLFQIYSMCFHMVHKMISDEDYLLTILRSHMSISDSNVRYYWRDSTGDHTTNLILMAETCINGSWQVLYVDESLKK